MSLLSSPFPDIAEPLWLPPPEYPSLPVHELHLWRARLPAPRWSGEESSSDCPVSRDHRENLAVALFRKDILERYTSSPMAGLIAGPSSGLRVALARCDHLALIAVSRDVRAVGLDVERVLENIPVDEMAGGFLDLRSQWDLRVTSCLQEKAWKFFRFWTSNEACDQVSPTSDPAKACNVRGFSPEANFVAAIAIHGRAESRLVYWDWEG